MRYTWTSIAIIIIWITAAILMTSDKLPDPEAFFGFLMVVTVFLSYIGLRSA